MAKHSHTTQTHRAQWDAIMAAVRTAEADPDDEAVTLAEILPRADALARLIWQAPVRDIADLKLLAETVSWRFWTDANHKLVNPPAHAMDEAGEEALMAL